MKRGLGLMVAAVLAVAGCSSSSWTDVAPGTDGGASGDAAPACTPVEASSEKVTVKNELGSLEGTLDVPAGCAGAPVVLVVSGSGSSDRDGNTPGDKDKPAIYKVLGESILASGFAVRSYDDPGVGKSASSVPKDVRKFALEMEVADTALFVAALRKDARFGPVVVAGHSEGSLLAILADQEEPLDGFISLAGAGRPVGRLLHDQLAPKLTAEQLAKLDAAIAKLEKGELAGPLDPPLDQVIPESVQPDLISWMKYDPKI